MVYKIPPMEGILFTFGRICYFSPGSQKNQHFTAQYKEYLTSREYKKYKYEKRNFFPLISVTLSTNAWNCSNARTTFRRSKRAVWPHTKAKLAHKTSSTSWECRTQLYSVSLQCFSTFFWFTAPFRSVK
jgi:hypothetical protein